MKLYVLDDVVPDGSGRVYRQSRVMGLVMTLVIGGAAVSTPILLVYGGAPWWGWGLGSLFALFVVPILLGDLLMKFRSTNWVLWLRPDGVWVNFRSYQDRGPTDVPCVVKLDWPEIAEAREHIHSYTTATDERSSVRHKVKCLDLGLTHADTQILVSALIENRCREPHRRNYFGIGIATRASHFAVSMPADNCIRIAWRGGAGHWVSPSLQDALAELVQHIDVSDASLFHRADWTELSDNELDDQIIDLVRAGATLDAVGLLIRRRGFSIGEARKIVEGLNAVV